MNTTTTHIRRRVGLGAILAAFTLFAGCTADVTETGAPEIVGDWGDPELYPEMGGAFGQYLTALAGTIAFDDVTGALTVTGTADAVQTIIIGRRAIDNAILVNGVATTTNNVLATSSTVKSVDVTATTGAQVLVLDFLNGLFGTATSSGGGFTIDLGDGTDALHVRGTTGNDRFTFGDAGISFNTDANVEIGATTTVEAYNISMAGGNDIFSAQGGAYGTGDNPFATLVTIYGGTGNDTITGTDLGDVLSGGEGDDTLWGMDGDDTLNGDAGDDTFEEGAATNGADTFNGGADEDTVNYGSREAALTVTIDDTGDDGLAGETDNLMVDVENVTGGSAADTLTGSAEDNVIRGGGGNDTITGGAGDDVLFGDDGDDIFDELDAASGADVFNGGAGTDTVDYSGRSNALTVTMNGSASDDGEAAEGDDVNGDIENLMDGSGNDTITGNNADNVFDDGGGDDTFDGGNGNDTLDAGDADDGADTFNGGAGIDFVDYSARVGAITVTMADDVANDGLSGEEDNIGADVENIDGASGAVVNTITGNDLDNIINGGGGADILDGGAGNDILYGAADDDELTGGDGDDTLDGGAGEDILDCGAGDDVATNEGSAVTDPVTIYLVACELG